MFELLCIFTNGGLVLWSQGTAWAPLNVLISQVLLSSKTHLTQFTHSKYILKWVIVPSLELVVAAAYEEIFPLVLVDQLLDNMKKSFCKLLAAAPHKDIRSVRFEDSFVKIYEKWLESSRETRRPVEQPEACFSTFLPAKGASVSSPAKPRPSGENKKPKKADRSWGIDNKITAKNMGKLDMSKSCQGQTRPQAQYLGAFSDSDSEEDSELPSGFFARLSSQLKNFTGNKQLSSADVAPILSEFRELLIQKNVAECISDELCQSVASSLVTTTTNSFTTVANTVKTAVRSAVQKLLTTHQSVDILRDALAAKACGKPYIIVFCGVNGVGKSTSLAKIGFYLKSKGDLSLLIAGCDTFRAGAIEQLRTHAVTLGVPLFEQGYGKIPANVARDAVKAAQGHGADVVLIDTAGRMQHNETLMQGLADLVNANRPDLVLFVGEALVGNDGVDQLVTFNRALIDRTVDGRGVDGVLLTKYDAVDDKVGATLSMVYSTGKPIVFVGVGEKYHHLKKMNVNEVLAGLFS